MKVERASGQDLVGPVNNALGLTINFEGLPVAPGDPIVVNVRCINQAGQSSMRRSRVLVMDGTPPRLRGFSLQSTAEGIYGMWPPQLDAPSYKENPLRSDHSDGALSLQCRTTLHSALNASTLQSCSLVCVIVAFALFSSMVTLLIPLSSALQCRHSCPLPPRSSTFSPLWSTRDAK